MNFNYYAGADWLQNKGNSLVPSLSEFGAKVADVLGLVYQGIYHIDEYVLRDRLVWDAANRIRLSIYTNLATWDFNQLTLLFLACYEQGISVEIAGAKKGTLRLTFWTSPPTFDVHELARSLTEPMPLFSLRSHLGMLSTEREKWRQPHNATVLDATSVAVSYPYNLSFKTIAEMVILAHHNAIRLDVTGLSYRSLQVTFSQRKREGHMFERHPDWVEALKMYGFAMQELPV